ncbi:VanZ family protein [Bacillus sp. B1-b2]|uniref:VanZ family protein n=1 Tax=Bacillus sp. B1-b2 TaxID=2653201 RepID=UPI001261CBC0|nr:VanZ family protein [Bacillus sp. B1-b2]KAB7670764.1 VanZ family protein [Bacillus sp. B1-b2]
MEETMSVMFTIPSWYVLVPLSVISFIWLMVWAKKRQKAVVPLTPKHFVVLITFGIYSLCVLHLVFFPIEVNIGIYANQIEWYKTINFIPLLTIDLTTFILNIIMLIPLGMYIPLLKKGYVTARNIAKLGFMISLSFELVQLLIRVTLGSGRTTDINDLLANTVGTVIGFIFMKRLLNISSMRSLFKPFKL